MVENNRNCKQNPLLPKRRRDVIIVLQGHKQNPIPHRVHQQIIIDNQQYKNFTSKNSTFLIHHENYL